MNDLHHLEPRIGEVGLAGFGGWEKTQELLERFRAKVKGAGFPDLHLNGVLYGNPILSGEQVSVEMEKVVERLGFDSVTSYVWIHHHHSEQFPEVDYAIVRDAYFRYWQKTVSKCSLPYYPNVTMGWDASPRTVQSDVFDNLGYPFMYTISNNTPAAFRKALAMTKACLAEQDVPHPFLTINAWNKWTEGSYLDPDLVHGTGYLEAIRDVFARH